VARIGIGLHCSGFKVKSNRVRKRNMKKRMKKLYWFEFKQEPPGRGKSGIISKVAKEMGWKVVDVPFRP